MNKKILLGWFIQKRLYIIIFLVFIIILFLSLVGGFIFINNKSDVRWKNVIGTVSINNMEDKKSSIVSLNINNVNNYFNKIKGKITLSLPNDTDNINLNGVLGKGEVLPYSNKIMDTNSKKIINYSIEKIKKLSKLIIIFNFNISDIQKFTYHLWVGNFNNTKNTIPSKNIKKTISVTNIKNITKINNTITDNPIYTTNGKNGIMGDMNAQLGYYPGIINSDYAFNTGLLKLGSHNFNTWNNFNTHIWRATDFAYYEKFIDCDFIINLSKHPLVFNYNSENNQKSKNILNGFSSTFHITGKDVYSGMQLGVYKKNVSMKFYSPLLKWLGENYNFQLGSDKTVSISFLKISVLVQSIARVDSIQGKVQMFIVPKIVQVVGQII